MVYSAFDCLFLYCDFISLVSQATILDASMFPWFARSCAFFMSASNSCCSLFRSRCNSKPPKLPFYYSILRTRFYVLHLIMMFSHRLMLFEQEKKPVIIRFRGHLFVKTIIVSLKLNDLGCLYFIESNKVYEKSLY
jgi:hypothetical protein